FSGLWSRRLEEGRITPPWIIGGVKYTQVSPPEFLIEEDSKDYSSPSTCQGYLNKIARNDSGVSVNILNGYDLMQGVNEEYLNNSEDSQINMANKVESEMMSSEEQMKNLILTKAERHRTYYRNLCGDNYETDVCEQMAKPVPCEISTTEYVTDSNSPAATTSELHADLQKEFPSNEGPATAKQRQRRTGVFQLDDNFTGEETVFVSVKQMRDKYLAMLEETSQKLHDNNKGLKGMPSKNKQKKAVTKSLSADSTIDDTFLAPPPSGYCSSSASGTSDDERERNWYKQTQLRRSGSSDSAVGLNQSDEDVPGGNSPTLDKKEFKEATTNTDYQCVRSPYSPRGSVDHVNVPSKTLIEAHYVPYPLDRKFSVCGSEGAECDDKNLSDSRRPSCFTDDGEEVPRFRYWRTPSVVVSDYSDDVVGLTLEDIEFFQNQRKDVSSSPDSSLHSSCSNLNYCGSSISNLDADYILRTPFRKTSDCSTCSTFSGDEDIDPQPPENTKEKVRFVCFCAFLFCYFDIN
ncbi:hypothetical protein ILUMI_06173, partial [Ignelater luminosus]